METGISIFAFLLAFVLKGALSDPYIKVTSDGPAVLDAPVRFSATLHDADDYEGPFYFRWSDDASPGHFDEKERDSTRDNYTVTYSSKEYEEREYIMTVRVYTKIAFFREELAASSLKYSITKTLNGRLQIVQKGSRDHIVSSDKETELKVRLHDPSGFLNDAVIQYFWFINDTNYGPSDKDSFSYQFSHPGVSSVEVLVMAKVAGDNNPAPALSNTAAVRNMSSDQITKSAPPYVKTGIFRNHVDSRKPMSFLNQTGETWLKHGRMLDITLFCDGSGPWDMCWSIKPNPYNATGNETCEHPEQVTTNCSFPVIWYFREAGMSDILAIVDNGISKEIKVIHVNVYDVHHQTPISIVVLPIACSLFAIIALAGGVILVVTFQRNLAVETADFDFTSPDEHELEYKTFWERLRDSMLNAFNNSSDDVSHISSVSSRSVQQPVTSIHYGSIS